MAATLRGEATIAGTDIKLVFDNNAIDRIEAIGEPSIFDLVEDIQRAIETGRKPKLSSMVSLLWGSFLRHNPKITRDEAYALAYEEDPPTMAAFGQALVAAFSEQKEAGVDAAADPPQGRLPETGSSGSTADGSAQGSPPKASGIKRPRSPAPRSSRGLKPSTTIVPG